MIDWRASNKQLVLAKRINTGRPQSSGGHDRPHMASRRNLAGFGCENQTFGKLRGH